MPSKKGQTRQERPGPGVTLERALHKEILGVLLIAAGGVTVLALLSITRGALSEAWVLFLRRIFGWAVYPVAAALVGSGLFLLWEELRQRLAVPARAIFGVELLFLALLGLSHLILPPEKAAQIVEQGGGGGYIGWAVSYFLVTAVGHVVAFLILLLIAGLGLILCFSLGWADLLFALGEARARLATWASPSEPADTPPATPREQRKSQVTAPLPSPVSRSRPAAARRRLKRLDRGLPPLDLLNGGAGEALGDADARYRAQLIEETLASFGVPAQVVEINVGPTVTQFGVEPGFTEQERSDGKSLRRKVKVSKIMTLQDDLALALAASPIRIEAPVPGRPVVGIEVPNAEVSLVGLRSVIESNAFHGMHSKLRIALGQDVAGQPIVADLAQMPHLLIAGATGSGKSVCINAITACLLLNNAPDTLQLLMFDPKRVELSIFNGVPHLVAPVVTNVEEAIRALRWATSQMDERYRLFSSLGMRNIEAYNESAPSRGEEVLPRLIVLIDELADLMMSAPDEIEHSICRIAQLARATGIHLVIATQRPSVDVVTGLIKANFPSRISFAVTTQVDSRVILDTAGAEKLLGRGDMLYMASDSSKLTRLQGCFVSDEELERIVQFWREKAESVEPGPEAPPWQDVALEESSDDLLDQAVALARGRESISTSFIQRRLRIGYPRAARLMDLLEEQGVVGPAENGKSRPVLLEADAPPVDS